MMDCEDLVSSVLKNRGIEEGKYKSINVSERPLEQSNDLGNLLGVEENEVAVNPEADYLKARTRDNVQLLMNELWGLTTELVDDVVIAHLPSPRTKIPREKPIPTPRPLTKWEEFAKSKGIDKKKKTRVVWDDAIREWVPRFGMKKAQAEVKKNWMMELKGNAPDDEDPFLKATEEKRERVAKNELHRLRNIARVKKVKIPSVKDGVLPSADKIKSSANELSRAAELAKKSTASLGKFQEKLSSNMEKNAKKASGKKRKFDPLVNEGEKERSLSILEKMSRKQPKLDVSKAVGKQIHQDEQRQSEQRKKGSLSKKGNRKGGNFAKGKKAGQKAGKRRSKPK